MQKNTLHRLDSNDSTLLIANRRGSASIIWFGERLSTIEDPDQLLRSLDLPCGKAKLDEPGHLASFPTAASGFLGNPALAAHSNGLRFSAAFTTRSITVAHDTLTLTMADAVAALSIVQTFTLDNDSSVLGVETTLVNESEAALQLDWLAACTLPLPDQFAEIDSFHGRWGLEFQRHKTPIGFARGVIENTAGRTSHEHFPGCICGAAGYNEDSGAVIGMHLAHSGNYRVVTQRLSSGEAYLQAGSHYLPGEVIVKAGESVKSPVMHLCSATGTNQMSQRLHQFVRHKILPAWTRRPRPVHANSWEALYFDHSTQSMLPLIDAAAAVGAERFVLDDGWFHGRRDDTAGLGDWWVDADIYPDGLHPLVRHIRTHDMQFGLWFEPEMVNPDSELYRQHPQWVLQVDGYETPLARQQLVLNLDLPEVRAYLFDCIAKLVNEYAIDYIKWDMNRDLVLAGNDGRAGSEKQVAGVYALLQKITATFPKLEIESCSSGGARADYAILRYTGRVWTSDSIDPIDRLQIQRSFSLFFPAEVMGAHVGHSAAHLTGRSTSLHTRAAVALQGQYGFELDARQLTALDRNELEPYTQLYKKNRDWMANSKLWRLDTRDKRLFIQGFVSNDYQHSFWSIVAQASLPGTTPERLVLRGLKPQENYTITAVSYQHLSDYAFKLPCWLNESITLSGDALMKTGLTLPVMPAQSAFVIECNSVSGSAPGSRA